MERTPFGGSGSALHDPPIRLARRGPCSRPLVSGERVRIVWKVIVSTTPLLVAGVAALVLAALLVVALRLEQPERRGEYQTGLGWWAPAEQQQRLEQILKRNPSFDERTGLTSDPELARWLRDNRP